MIILGASIFRDVGPRTQFVIIILERRSEDLARADDVEEIPVTDLRPLVNDLSTVGTSSDPRLIALDVGALPLPQNHLPSRGWNFTLFPASDVVTQVEVFPNVLHGDNPRRVFIKKWPGIITAFDELFRGDTRESVGDKAEQFLAAATLEGSAREAALDDLARSIGAKSTKSRSRLSLMATHAAEGGLAFDASKIRRVITGSAPNEVAWYPDHRLFVWIYYEPRLRIPRNVHEGRDPGYGTMSQWRDADSHMIDPKFVFTTGTNPDYGLKALIVPGDWMVKLHGGESQQFHYTGLSNPLAQPSLSGPNNLGDDAIEFFTALTDAGFAADDFLFYLAGIYNSKISEDYLEGGGANVLRIPLSLSLIESGAAGRVINFSRTIRNLHWLGAEAGAGMDADLVQSLLGHNALKALSLEETGGTGGRFRQRKIWRGTDTTDALINENITLLRPQLDEAVEDLFVRSSNAQVSL